MAPTLYLKPGHARSLLRHHPWLFSGAVDEERSAPVLRNLKAGAAVYILDSEGRFLAQGLYSPLSQIRVRVLSFNETDVLDDSFIARRLTHAVRERDGLASEGCDGLRLVASEGDYLPGLIVDKYNDVLVIAISSVGMERFRDCIIATLREFFPECLIYERSESASREKEGLSPRAGLIAGDESALPEVLYVKEYGEVYLPVNVRSGHKTGGYLDQRQSRRYLKSLTHGRSVLNCFAYTGGFGLWALKGGASRVFNVDVSDLALRAAKEGVAFNHLDPGRCRFIKEDVFEFLRNEAASGNSYDVIVLDPPKFAESARTLKSACRGYQDINRLAFSLLREGGDLLTFSCSGHMEPSLFQKIVADAALEAGVEAHIVSTLRQDRDHPVALSCPESFYLKGLHVRVSATGLPLPLKEEKNRPVDSETAESSKPAPRSRKGQRRTGPRH